MKRQNLSLDSKSSTIFAAAHFIRRGAMEYTMMEAMQATQAVASCLIMPFPRTGLSRFILGRGMGGSPSEVCAWIHRVAQQGRAERSAMGQDLAKCGCCASKPKFSDSNRQPTERGSLLSPESGGERRATVTQSVRGVRECTALRIRFGRDEV